MINFNSCSRITVAVLFREYKTAEKQEKLTNFAEQDKSLQNLANAMTLPNLRQARYVGVGYNQIRGAPEGIFSRGGIDPGIKVSRHIHRFTYNEGKIERFLNENWGVPDQVIFQLLSSCSGSTERRAYSGTKSYQSSIAASISVEGKYAV